MAKKFVRIHFMDDSSKAFPVDDVTTAEQLKNTIVERLDLKEHGCFAIFEKKDNWERCLDNEEKPCELMTLWNIDPKKKDSNKQESLSELSCAFIFKKKIFLRDDEKEMQDPVARNLVYIQAVHSVIESEYPCTIEDALRLASLQVQIVYGDHRPSTFVVGFLTQNLKQYIPKDLYPLKKPQEWESLILKAHGALVGKKAEEAQLDYLDIVKQWPFYGTTFYPPCKCSNNRRLPAKVIIGVNAEGILLLNKKDKELVSTHPFTEICSWASSGTTFAFEFGSQTESQKYTFETKHGAIIAATIQTYIDILVQMLKSGADDEEDDEQ